MTASGGRIITITSVHGHTPRVGSGAYYAAQGGLGLLTKVMAQELAASGITVDAVAPGEIATQVTIVILGVIDGSGGPGMQLLLQAAFRP